MKRWLFLFSWLASLPFCAFAADSPAFPQLQVLPWNGHKAAISLTFDDSDPSHLDVAVPELNKRKMHGTFYLIANKTDRKDDWRKALAGGHELANHTLDHKHASELKPEDEKSQVSGAQNVLQKEFGVPVRTFAYPFTEITPSLKAWVVKTHLLARGGYGNGVYNMKPDSEPDWMNISSRTTMSATPLATYQQWIEEDFEQGAWLVFMIHGLEGTPWGWEPITKKNFTGLLDSIQSKDIWAGNFQEVGAYFMAQRILEKSVPSDSGVQRTWKWSLPDLFPENTVLRIRLSGQVPKGLEMIQGKRKIEPDAQGIYAVPMSGKSLTLQILPKS